jgi:hypothetical protein
MRIEATTIEELIANAGPHGDTLAKLDGLLETVAPQLPRQLFSGPSITMIGYGELVWENMSSSGVWPVIAIAPQKHYVSIYVAAERDGQPLVQAYGKALGRVDLGKNCLRIKRFDDLDVNAVASMIRDAAERAMVQERIYGRDCARPVPRSRRDDAHP